METITNESLRLAGEATPWNNHLPLLWLALEETETGAVMEMGCGEGSTQWLHDYCNHHNRILRSYDESVEWASKYRHLHSDKHHVNHIGNWDTLPYPEDLTVVLIDHSPGEDRYKRALNLKDLKGIIICHDTEQPPCGGNYQWEKAFKEFRYFARVKSPSADGVHNGVWATAISNHYDMSHWHGMQIGTYTIEP